jgi:hypothetical protein
VISVQFITKETLDKYIGDKSIIGLNVFLELIEHEFGFAVPLKDNLSEEQVKKVSKAISENEEILIQIRSAKAKRDQAFSSYNGNEDDFDKLVFEVNDGRI